MVKMEKSEIIKYLQLILNKWVLWLFVLLDFVGVLVQIFFTNFTLPPIAYGIFAIIGFFWAGYQVYRETVNSFENSRAEIVKSYENSIQEYREKLQKLSEEVNVDDILKEQNLNLSLKEGQGYIFTFGKDG